MADSGIDPSQLPIDFDDMDLDAFMMWSEPALRSFLAIRNKNTEGDFKTLAARAFNAYEEHIPVQRRPAQTTTGVLQGEVGPPIALPYIMHWSSPRPIHFARWVARGIRRHEVLATCYSNTWDIAKYLNMKCSTELINRLMNEYKEG